MSACECAIVQVCVYVCAVNTNINKYMDTNIHTRTQTHKSSHNVFLAWYVSGIGGENDVAEKFNVGDVCESSGTTLTRCRERAQKLWCPRGLRTQARVLDVEVLDPATGFFERRRGVASPGLRDRNEAIRQSTRTPHTIRNDAHVNNTAMGQHKLCVHWTSLCS